MAVAMLAVSPAPTRADSWAVYYADKAAVRDFAGFKLVVLDSTYHPPLAELKRSGKRLLGYISLGEVEAWRSHFASVRDEGILLGEIRIGRRATTSTCAIHAGRAACSTS
jgi:hypothetical protein